VTHRGGCYGGGVSQGGEGVTPPFFFKAAKAMYAQTRPRQFAKCQFNRYQRQLPFSPVSLDSGKTLNKPLPNFPTSYGIGPGV
jgi:hypothetical protein